MTHYDLVLFGEEIAGRWLLNQLKPSPKMQRILWLRKEGESSVPYSLSQAIAKYFEIPSEEVLDLELAFPKSVFAWDKNKMTSLLKDFQWESLVTSGPSPKFQRIAEFVLKQNSQLPSISRGIWNFSSFADSVPKETELWAASLNSQLNLWKPTASYHVTVEERTYRENEKLQMIKLTHGETVLKLDEETAISTPRFVLNSELSQFQKVVDAETFERLGFTENIFSKYAEYQMKLDFEKGTFLPLSRLTLLYSTDDTPDSFNEISFIERRDQELTLRVIDRRLLSFSHLLENFKTSIRDLSRGFSGLLRKTKSLYPPLDLETCHREDFRSEVISDLLLSRRDLYRLSQTSSATSVQSCINLGPSVNCHLPYPLGTLSEARKYLLSNRLT